MESLNVFIFLPVSLRPIVTAILNTSKLDQLILENSNCHFSS